uniref:Uncharacterized protein n=1 Tax=Nelumbo nucifera TaxID=4432 RepID=A0A822ZEV8_NELNU|nr:TPA_asm: hypothetical protein HUJ06_000511 [Nelumbo nucifera]
MLYTSKKRSMQLINTLALARMSTKGFLLESNGITFISFCWFTYARI